MHYVLPKVYRKYRNFDNDNILIPAKKDIEIGISELSNKELARCLKSECFAGNTQPYVHIHKIKCIDIIQI